MHIQNLPIHELHNYFYIDDELDKIFLGFNTITFIFNINHLRLIPWVDNLDPFLSGTIDNNHYVIADCLNQEPYRVGQRILDILKCIKR